MTLPGLDEVVAAAETNAADVDRRARFPRETIDALARTRLLGLNVPVDLGGRGHGLVEAFEVLATLSQRCASSAMILTMHYTAVATLLAGNHDGRFDRVLRAVAAGDHLSTLALSERATRSNFWISMGHAERRDGCYQLRVEKTFVTSAGPAQSYVVSTATPDRQSLDDTELFLVGADDGGVEVLDWWQGSGLRGNASAPVRFDTVVPERAHIGGPGSGRHLLLEVILPWFQLGTASVSVGLSCGAAEVTRRHVLDTRLEHLDERLVDQPVVRHGLGRLHAQADALSGFVRTVAEAMASGTARREHIFELKVVANEVALQVTELAMRLGGGHAYAGRSAADRLFRDARAGMIMAPTADMLYDMIGRLVVGDAPL